jgi:hypothetical protein
MSLLSMPSDPRHINPRSFITATYTLTSVTLESSRDLQRLGILVVHKTFPRFVFIY